MKLKYLSLIIVISLSCNPVKKVLNDPAKFDRVAEEVIRRGKCVNDTVTITEVKDSVVYKDSIVETIKNIPCKDFDSTIGRARIKVSSGVLSYSTKDSVVYRTKTVTNTVKDRSLENLLRGDIAKLNQNLADRDELIKSEYARYKKLSSEHTWLKVRLWFLIIAALIITFRKPIFRWLFSKL